LDSSIGFYHGIPLKNSLKEMNEYYYVCKEDLDKENTAIKIHHGTKLEKIRQHNFNWVVNHIGLKKQKNIAVHLTTAAQNPAMSHPVTRERFPYHK
jgi:tRNA U34 2-thiouridine synthase MnmA/TrmU